MGGVEKGLKALEVTMTKSFQAGESRFSKIENKLESLDDRVSTMENNEQPEEVQP